MPDFGSEVMAEALAQRALVKPVYTIPIIPLSNSNQYRHQDHLDMKDYKKVRPPYVFCGTRRFAAVTPGTERENDFCPSLAVGERGRRNRMSAEASENVSDFTFVLHFSQFAQR